MSVTFDLPSDIEQDLRRQLPDLENTAKEAALIELYRQHQLSHLQLSIALGLSRLETDLILKKHNVIEDLPTENEHAAALSRLQSMTQK